MPRSASPHGRGCLSRTHSCDEFPSATMLWSKVSHLAAFITTVLYALLKKTRFLLEGYLTWDLMCHLWRPRLWGIKPPFVVQYCDTITISPPSTHVLNRKFAIYLNSTHGRWYVNIYYSYLGKVGVGMSKVIRSQRGVQGMKERRGWQRVMLTCAPFAGTYSGGGLWPGPSCFGLLLPALDLGETEGDRKLFENQV